MSRNLNWKKIKEESYKAGWRKMVKKTFLLLNGKTSDYDIIDDGGTVSILAITEEKQVILIKVFRPGPEKTLMEMPGGLVEENESPIDAAERELLEETGYSGKFELAGEIIDDAYSNRIRSCFVIKNCKKVSDPKWDDDEESEIVKMDLDKFRKHLRSGQLTDVESGYICLDYLNLL